MEPTRPKPAGTVTFLRYWLIGSGLVIACLLIWTVAPVLFPVAALTVGLGLLSAVIVGLARRLERWKHDGKLPPEET